MQLQISFQLMVVLPILMGEVDLRRMSGGAIGLLDGLSEVVAAAKLQLAARQGGRGLFGQLIVTFQANKPMADSQQRQARDSDKKKPRWQIRVSNTRMRMPTLASALMAGSLVFTSSRLSRTTGVVMRFQRMVSSSADSPRENWRSSCQQLFTNSKTP